MKTQLLRCKKIPGWLPDGYLTSIVGYCDRGRFVITKEFTFNCSLLQTGNLFIEGFEQLELTEDEFDLSQVRCGTCGGPVELVEVNPEEILEQIRHKEINMKRASQAKESSEDTPKSKKDD